MTDILKYLDEDGVTWKPFTTAVGDAASIGGATLPAILDAIFPVGATYVSGSDTLPTIIAAIGTWERLKGRIIIGVDEGQSEFNTVDKLYGSKSHNHGFGGGNAFADIIGEGSYIRSRRVNKSFSNNLNHRQTVTGAAFEDYNTNLATSVSGATDINVVMPPVKAKYMWERTA